MRSSPRPTSRTSIRWSLRALGTVAIAAAATVSPAPAYATMAHAPHRPDPKPTIVLVHGAWADASSWTGVINRLQHDGYRVRAIPNQLRSLSGDAANVNAFLATLSGQVVLVGHSYGGAVITNAADGDRNIKALVYVNADIPDQGQSVAALAGPDSALSVTDPTSVFDFVPQALPPTPESEIYLKTSIFRTAFATGVRARQVELLAATQRPITLAALNEPSGSPAWRSIPAWALVGTRDEVIPPSAQLAMARHANAAVSYYGAGHLGLISDPAAVTRVIERAANSVDRHRGR